jgi:hypothetical protein
MLLQRLCLLGSLHALQPAKSHWSLQAELGKQYGFCRGSTAPPLGSLGVRGEPAKSSGGRCSECTQVFGVVWDILENAWECISWPLSDVLWCVYVHLLNPTWNDPDNIPGVSTREPIAATQRMPSGSVAPFIGPSTEARQLKFRKALQIRMIIRYTVYSKKLDAQPSWWHHVRSVWGKHSDRDTFAFWDEPSSIDSAIHHAEICGVSRSLPTNWSEEWWCWCSKSYKSCHASSNPF